MTGYMEDSDVEKPRHTQRGGRPRDERGRGWSDVDNRQGRHRLSAAIRHWKRPEMMLL